MNSSCLFWPTINCRSFVRSFVRSRHLTTLSPGAKESKVKERAAKGPPCVMFALTDGVKQSSKIIVNLCILLGEEIKVSPKCVDVIIKAP